jgi:hypothetical protein
LDEKTEKLIKKRAESEHTSVNRIVKELLRNAFGIGNARRDRREEFLDLFGVWTDDDEKCFSEAIRDLEAISPEDWR